MVFQFSVSSSLWTSARNHDKGGQKAIYAILETADINDEELILALTGAEALINSRRLTNQSMDPNENVPLTPNHFCADKLADNLFFLQHAASNLRKL